MPVGTKWNLIFRFNLPLCNAIVVGIFINWIFVPKSNKNNHFPEHFQTINSQFNSSVFSQRSAHKYATAFVRIRLLSITNYIHWHIVRSFFRLPHPSPTVGPYILSFLHLILKCYRFIISSVNWQTFSCNHFYSLSPKLRISNAMSFTSHTRNEWLWTKFCSCVRQMRYVNTIVIWKLKPFSNENGICLPLTAIDRIV